MEKTALFVVRKMQFRHNANRDISIDIPEIMSTLFDRSEQYACAHSIFARYAITRTQTAMTSHRSSHNNQRSSQPYAMRTLDHTYQAIYHE